MFLGSTNRTIAVTNMNATSSRAHTIVSIIFQQKSFGHKNISNATLVILQERCRSKLEI
jgi:hypothetical protein